jgi:hypothetical protein
MSQLDPRLVSSLQELVLAAKAIGSGLQRSCWEIWGPPLLSIAITALGWWVVVWSNQKNNRNLLELQRRDHAVSRILDALDAYLAFLDDVEDPSRVLWRDQALAVQQIAADRKRLSETGLDSPAANSGTVAPTSLLFSDNRGTRWLEVLLREAWTYNTDKDVPDDIATLEKCHQAIILDLAKDEQQMLLHARTRDSATSSFVAWTREPHSIEVIALQRDGVLKLYTRLSTPDSSHPAKTNKDRLKDAITLYLAKSQAKRQRPSS